MLRIIGQAVVGSGEADRYMEDTLKEFKRLCDDVVVCCCNAGIKEKALLRKYRFRYYDDDREWGFKQPYIKTDLLKRIIQLSPDWILPLDMDETMPSVNREILESLTKGREACQFYVTNLWNDEQHYAKALSFYNVRFYKNKKGMETQFLKKPVHCGNAPPYFYSIPAKQTYVPHILLHKGLMKKEDRLKKVERYRIYDPNAIHKGEQYYNSLSSDGTGSEYNQQAVLLKLKNLKL
ncbi:MAG: hypothetical protein WC319_08900 [Candidatus Paceibacterota bacterium]|jgi:hypothetical protein